MTPYTNLVHLSADQLDYAKRIVRAKTSINDPNPHVMVAAIMYATNPNVLETKRITTYTPPPGDYVCNKCTKKWYSRRDSIMCCKYGPPGDKRIPINKGRL
ncbi:hypothetical protein EhV18_00417 [Emiliania huxleyi virus 18]|nr:hypothetical protein EhV18_00417 [Emiliania huxleyi virus 18]AHA55506.1 hypothetical protein EhV156_00411 [Emiliania huxleyi virus 156]